MWSLRISGSTKRGLADRLGTWVRAARSAVGSSSGTPSARSTGSVRKLVTRIGGPRRALATTTAESTHQRRSSDVERARTSPQPAPRAAQAARAAAAPRRLRTPRRAQNDPPPDRAPFAAKVTAVGRPTQSASPPGTLPSVLGGHQSVACLPRPRRLTWTTLVRFCARCAPRAPIPGKTMLLLIDNYDSFTYNLVHYLGELGAEAVVYRNDALTVQDAVALRARRDRDLARPLRPRSRRHHPAAGARRRRAVPGPRRVPRPSGDRPGVRRHDQPRADQVMHGKLSPIEHDGTGVFADLPIAVRGHPLPFPDRRTRDRAGRARGQCADRRRHDHGPAASDACRSTACSSIPRASRPSTATALLRNFLELAGVGGRA